MGSVLEGLRKDNKYVVFYPVFFIIRRCSFAIQAVFFGDAFSFQIHMQIVLAVTQISYLLAFKPFNSPFQQKLEVMNETVTLILMYHVITLN